MTRRIASLLLGGVLSMIVSCSASLQKTIRELNYTPVALPSTAYRPGQVVYTVQKDPFQSDPVCEYGSYIGSPLATKDEAASIQVSQSLTGAFSLGADYLKQIKGDIAYQYVKDITVTLNNVSVETISDNKVNSGLDAQQPGCTQAIKNFQDRSRLGFLQSALKADVVYKVTFDGKASLTAEEQQALLQGLALKLDASSHSVTNNQISGKNLYWGVRPPRPDLVLTANPSSPQPPPQCPPLQTKMFSNTGAEASHPRVEVDVPPQYKILGGGAIVNWRGNGNLLTATFPENSHKWVATSKDHQVVSPATITGWTIALYDPNDDWDVSYTSSTGQIAAHPSAHATVPEGYIMTGGGARVNWSGTGNLLTASYPIDTQTWEAASKDHEVSSPADVTAYVIGIKPRHCVWAKHSRLFRAEGGAAAHPVARIDIPSSFVLTGGGARDNWTEAGNLLTATFPTGESGWEARGKDHDVSSPATISVFAIGVPK